jgi:hypothetical protein
MLQLLRDSEQRMRAIATENRSKLTAGLLDIADEFQADAVKLESELIAEGLIARAE